MTCSRSASELPNGMRSSSWNVTPHAPSSASRWTVSTGSSAGRVATPNGSLAGQPTVQSPKEKRSSGDGARSPAVAVVVERVLTGQPAFACRTWPTVGRPSRPAVSSHRQGVVVDSVNVSVLLYVPVRGACFAPTGWRNESATVSLLTGAPYLRTGPSGPKSPPTPAGLDAFTWSA